MKTSFAVAPTNISDTTFRAWGKAVSDALEAVGFIKTADTGQINWATVTAPLASAYSGYEIRRMDDALQATVPVFAKIWYGAATGQASPRMVIYVGRASDGAGNLTGITANPVSLICGAASVTAADCYVSCGAGYVSMAIWVNASTTVSPLTFYIARNRDADGAVNSKGVNIVGQYGNVFSQQWLPAEGSAMPSTPMIGPFCAAPKVGLGTYGTTVGVFPVFSYMGFAGHPDGIGLVYFGTDMAGGGVPTTIELFGSDQVFVTGGTSNATSANGNANVCGLLVRWE